VEARDRLRCDDHLRRLFGAKRPARDPRGGGPRQGRIPYAPRPSAPRTIVNAIKEVASITGAFKDALIAWLGSTTNGLTRIHTQELCINDTCVNEDQLKSLLGASAAGAATASDGQQEETPAASSAPVGADADTATTTTSASDEADADASEQGGTEAPAVSAQEEDVGHDDGAEDESVTIQASQTSPQSDASSPPSTEAANDNGPSEDLPATGTE
jgi:hypothetical protein